MCRSSVSGPSSRFLSTPSARRATDLAIFQPALTQISIHALREEGDEYIERLAEVFRISIHALREEGDDCNFG